MIVTTVMSIIATTIDATTTIDMNAAITTNAATALATSNHHSTNIAAILTSLAAILKKLMIVIAIKR